MAKNKLSIYLFNEGTVIKDAVKNFATSSKENIDGGTFFWKKSVPKKSSWVKNFFDDRLSRKDEMTTSSCQGAYLLEVQVTDDVKRLFAVCFGGGHNLLRLDKVEPRFGLMVTLNSVDPKSIRSVDITSLESIPKNNRMQSSSLIEVGLFGIDEDKDLIKAATGSCLDTAFSQNVTGKTSLIISNVAKVGKTLEQTLRKAYSYFVSTKYKANFEWIDRIKPVDDSPLISELDKILVNNLNTKNYEKVWIGAPEIIDWENIAGFKVQGKKDLLDDLTLKEVLDSLKFKNKDTGKLESLIPNSDGLKERKIKVSLATNPDLDYKSWKVYNCLNSEIEKDRKLYFLNNGLWYYVENEFVKKINTYYNKASTTTSVVFPGYDVACRTKASTEKRNDGEGKYNKKLSASISDSVLLDAKNISYGGGKSRIEVCDVLTPNKQLIHIKVYSNSATLSHLFSQGLNSAQLLIDDDSFRKEVRNKITEEKGNQELIAERDFQSKDFEIIFGIIMGKKVVLPDIPFFSKITFKHVSQMLKAYGYKVSITSIPIV